AQRFSAGWEPGTVNKSVKRTTERYRSAGFRLSRPLRGLYESLCPSIPPMNRDYLLDDSRASQRREYRNAEGVYQPLAQGCARQRATLGSWKLICANPVSDCCALALPLRCAASL